MAKQNYYYYFAEIQNMHIICIDIVYSTSIVYYGLQVNERAVCAGPFSWKRRGREGSL